MNTILDGLAACKCYLETIDDSRLEDAKRLLRTFSSDELLNKSLTLRMVDDKELAQHFVVLFRIKLLMEKLA